MHTNALVLCLRSERDQVEFQNSQMQTHSSLKGVHLRSVWVIKRTKLAEKGEILIFLFTSFHFKPVQNRELYNRNGAI